MSTRFRNYNKVSKQDVIKDKKTVSHFTLIRNGEESKIGDDALRADIRSIYALVYLSRFQAQDKTFGG